MTPHGIKLLCLIIAIIANNVGSGLVASHYLMPLVGWLITLCIVTVYSLTSTPVLYKLYFG